MLDERKVSSMRRAFCRLRRSFVVFAEAVLDVMRFVADAAIVSNIVFAGL